MPLLFFDTIKHKTLFQSSTVFHEGRACFISDRSPIQITCSNPAAISIGNSKSVLVVFLRFSILLMRENTVCGQDSRYHPDLGKLYLVHTSAFVLGFFGLCEAWLIDLIEADWGDV